MSDFDFEDNFFFSDANGELETTEKIPIQVHKKKLKKLEMINILKREKFAKALPEFPEKDYSYHIVSNGDFDFFTVIPMLVEKHPAKRFDEFYGSTWTMNRGNVNTIFEMFDKNQIGNINILTGTYFKRRESAVYAQLLNGILKREQKYKCFENHAKIALMGNHTTGDYIIIEGSANFTANPRAEQYVINNNKDLFLFHKNWMDTYLNGK